MFFKFSVRRICELCIVWYFGTLRYNSFIEFSWLNFFFLFLNLKKNKFHFIFWLRKVTCILAYSLYSNFFLHKNLQQRVNVFPDIYICHRQYFFWDKIYLSFVSKLNLINICLQIFLNINFNTSLKQKGNILLL